MRRNGFSTSGIAFKILDFILMVIVKKRIIVCLYFALSLFRLVPVTSYDYYYICIIRKPPLLLLSPLQPLHIVVYNVLSFHD